LRKRCSGKGVEIMVFDGKRKTRQSRKGKINNTLNRKQEKERAETSE